MKIEHVHNFEIAGFDLNFTITTVIIAAVSIDLKSFPLPHLYSRLSAKPHIHENEMHSQFNSLSESVMPFNSAAFNDAPRLNCIESF